MLQFWSITESTQKRQTLLMLMARSEKVFLALQKDRKASVAGWSRDCVVTHFGFCVWGCCLFCVLDPLNSHWSPTGTFLLSLLSAMHPWCTILTPRRICSLSEITGVGTLTSVFLLAGVYVPFPMTFMLCYSTSITWLGQFQQLTLISVLAGGSARTCACTQ